MKKKLVMSIIIVSCLVIIIAGIINLTFFSNFSNEKISLSPTSAPTLQSLLKPGSTIIAGYYHPLSGGYVSLWDNNGNAYLFGNSFNNKIEWFLAGVTGRPYGFPANFNPKFGYYSPVNVGAPFENGLVSLWDKNGVNYYWSSSVGYLPAHWWWKAGDSGKPGRPEGLTENFNPIVGYYEPSNGGRVVLINELGDMQVFSYARNQWVSLGKIIPGLSLAPKIAYYYDFGNNIKGVNLLFNIDNQLRMFQSIDGKTEEITSQIKGLPSGFPNAGYFDNKNNVIVLIYGTDTYASYNGKDFCLFDYYNPGCFFHEGMFNNYYGPFTGYNHIEGTAVTNPYYNSYCISTSPVPEWCYEKSMKVEYNYPSQLYFKLKPAGFTLRGGNFYSNDYSFKQEGGIHLVKVYDKSGKSAEFKFENTQSPLVEFGSNAPWDTIRQQDIAKVPTGWSQPNWLTNVNTNGWEDSAYISSDGKTLYFSYLNADVLYEALNIWFSGRPIVYPGPDRDPAGSCRNGEHCGLLSADTFYSSKQTDGSWSVPKPYQLTLDSSINGLFLLNENKAYFQIYWPGPQIAYAEKINGVWGSKKEIAVLKGYQDPFVTSDDNVILSSGVDRFGNEQIYFSKKVNGQWQTPIILPTPINGGSINKQPFMFENYLYFASNKDDGKLKIYRSVYNGGDMSLSGSWSNPELFISSNVAVGEPTLSSDGKTMFFVQIFKSPNSGSDGKDRYNADIMYITKIP